MMIFNDQNGGVTFLFAASEINVALQIAKAIYKATNAKFVGEWVRDREAALKPKLLPMINYWHTCEKCTRSIDERDAGTMRIQHDDEIKWQCRNCPPFKLQRPV